MIRVQKERSAETKLNVFDHTTQLLENIRAVFKEENIPDSHCQAFERFIAKMDQKQKQEALLEHYIELTNHKWATHKGMRAKESPILPKEGLKEPEQMEDKGECRESEGIEEQRKMKEMVMSPSLFRVDDLKSQELQGMQRSFFEFNFQEQHANSPRKPNGLGGKRNEKDQVANGEEWEQKKEKTGQEIREKQPNKTESKGMKEKSESHSGQATPKQKESPSRNEREPKKQMEMVIEKPESPLILKGDGFSDLFQAKSALKASYGFIEEPPLALSLEKGMKPKRSANASGKNGLWNFSTPNTHEEKPKIETWKDLRPLQINQRENGIENTKETEKLVGNLKEDALSPKMDEKIAKSFQKTQNESEKTNSKTKWAYSNSQEAPSFETPFKRASLIHEPLGPDDQLSTECPVLEDDVSLFEEDHERLNKMLLDYFTSGSKSFFKSFPWNPEDAEGFFGFPKSTKYLVYSPEENGEKVVSGLAVLGEIKERKLPFETKRAMLMHFSVRDSQKTKAFLAEALKLLRRIGYSEQWLVHIKEENVKNTKGFLEILKEVGFIQEEKDCWVSHL